MGTSGNHSPKIYKAIPNDNQIIYRLKDNKESIIIFAEDEDGDLDKFVWDFSNVKPINSDGTADTNDYIEENSASNFL